LKRKGEKVRPLSIKGTKTFAKGKGSTSKWEDNLGHRKRGDVVSPRGKGGRHPEGSSVLTALGKKEGRTSLLYSNVKKERKKREADQF